MSRARNLLETDEAGKNGESPRCDQRRAFLNFMIPSRLTLRAFWYGIPSPARVREHSLHWARYTSPLVRVDVNLYDGILNERGHPEQYRRTLAPDHPEAGAIAKRGHRTPALGYL